MSTDPGIPADGVDSVLDEVQRMRAQGGSAAVWTALRRIADSGRAREAAAVSLGFGQRSMRHNAPGDAQRARAAFELAYEAGEGDTVATAAIQLAYFARQDGDVESAMEYLECAAQSETGHVAATAAYELGVLLQRTHDLDGAQRWYRRAMQGEDAGSAAGSASVNLGVLRQEAGDLDSASELFRWACENGKGKVPGEAAYALGELLRREGETAQAEAMFEWSARARFPAALLALGRLLAAAGRLAEAEAALRQAADVYGDMAALTALGNVLVLRADPGNGLAQLLASRSMDELLHAYTSHLPAGPEIAEAEECFRQAAAAGEHSALVHLGHLLMCTGRGPEADGVLRQAVQVGAAGAEAELATLLLLRGEVAEAARVLEPAVAAGNAAALITRATLYGHEDRPAQAVDLLRRAMAAGGAALGAGAQLFILLALLGDLDGAQDALREMITTNDEAGLAVLHLLLANLPALQEDLRRARDSGDADVFRQFTARLPEALQD